MWPCAILEARQASKLPSPTRPAAHRAHGTPRLPAPCHAPRLLRSPTSSPAGSLAPYSPPLRPPCPWATACSRLKLGLASVPAQRAHSRSRPSSLSTRHPSSLTRRSRSTPRPFPELTGMAMEMEMEVETGTGTGTEPAEASSTCSPLRCAPPPRPRRPSSPSPRRSVLVRPPSSGSSLKHLALSPANRARTGGTSASSSTDPTRTRPRAAPRG
jgi:hypothetical protein